MARLERTFAQNRIIPINQRGKQSPENKGLSPKKNWTKNCRQRQGSNLRGWQPLDFKSNPLTTRARCLIAIKRNKKNQNLTYFIHIHIGLSS